MKTLCLECTMGASGDMLTAALLDLLDDKQAFIDKMNSLGLEGVRVFADTAEDCGVVGLHVTVKIGGEEEHSEDIHSHEHHHHEHEHHHHHDHEHDNHHHHHHHTSMKDIETLINRLEFSDKVKSDALAVYRLIAEAEAHAHGREVDQIHFHEVGTMDAVADIVGVCLLMEQLSPERVAVTPIHVGCGQVRCAHGILPVPAPATAYILRGVPAYGGAVEGELCTPTGAALLKYFADSFGELPVMRTERVGMGIGSKRFSRMNLLRAFLGETDEGGAEQICELVCNLDDMTAEDISYACTKLLDGGALDAFTQSVCMKKGRQGTLLTCLCRAADKDGLVRLIFKHTSTIGVRERLCERYVLSRREETVQTSFGSVRVKVSEGYGVRRAKPEFDDLSRLADENGIGIDEIRRQIK